MNIDPAAVPLWWSRARCLRTVDGDTYILLRDKTERTYQEGSYRLWGLDTPELSTDEGKAARAYAQWWYGEHAHGVDPEQGWPLIINTDKDKQTFNRYVAKIWCSQGHSLEDALRAAGYEKL